jgi:hypothetical protein
MGMRRIRLPHGSTMSYVVRFRFAPFAVLTAFLLLANIGVGRADTPPSSGAMPAATQEKAPDKKPAPKKDVKPTVTPAATGSPGSTSQDAAALSRERLKRCQLHPGTCVQGNTSDAAHYAREQ